jgi:hypothetical protein
MLPVGSQVPLRADAIELRNPRAPTRPTTRLKTGRLGKCMEASVRASFTSIHGK